MSNGFQADPAKLAKHAADFPGYADLVGAIHGELTSALAATGQCWGDDAAGRSFADGHVQQAGDILDGLATLPDKLTDVGSRFTATASGYASAEDYATGLLSDGSQ
jgi:uncharacterized protein YukE